MNWQERLNKWAESLEKSSDKAIDFGSAEIPLYVQEWLRWEFWYGLSMASLCSILVMACVLCMRWVYRHEYNPYAKGEMLSPSLILIAMMCILFGPVFLWFGVQNAAKSLRVAISPRVVIVEHVSSLVRR